MSQSNDSGLNLDHLEALAHAATPGEWIAKPHGRIVGGPPRHYTNGTAQAQIASFSVTYHEHAPDDEPERQQANTDFAAAANPAAVLELIALARRATLANQPAPIVPAAVYQVERNRCDCHPETCCCNAWAIVRIEGEQRKKHSTHAARTVADEIALALAHQPAQEQAEPDESRVDAVVTALYRRFKGWSKRGWGPDDVTWCEVKADVIALIAAGAAQEQAALVGYVDRAQIEWLTRSNSDTASIQLWRTKAPIDAVEVYTAQQEPVAAPQQATAPGLVPKFEGQFDSHQDWVNRASRVLAGRREPAVCVDALGRRCHIGADMRRAKEEDAFPVRYFWECERAAQQAAAPGNSPEIPDGSNSAPGTPEAPKPPFPISDDEMAALRRFWECATDGEGYDVDKSMMQRLAEKGLVQRKGGAYYMSTEFGLYVLGEYTVQRAAQLDGGQEGSDHASS